MKLLLLENVAFVSYLNIAWEFMKIIVSLIEKMK
jgi:hypothetical protein